MGQLADKESLHFKGQFKDNLPNVRHSWYEADSALKWLFYILSNFSWIIILCQHLHDPCTVVQKNFESLPTHNPNLSISVTTSINQITARPGKNPILFNFRQILVKFFQTFIESLR